MTPWLLAIGLSLADEPAPTEDLDEGAAVLLEHNTRRRQHQVSSMSVLVGWGAGNVAVGAAGWAVADTLEWRSFHQMSLGWGAINLAIGVPALVGALREEPSGFDLRGTLRKSTGLRVSFAVNTGLDVGYVALGAWMAERGLRTGEERLVGFGRSFILQGGFLLVFDLTMWIVRSGEDHRLLIAPILDPQRGMVGVRGAF